MTALLPTIVQIGIGRTGKGCWAAVPGGDIIADIHTGERITELRAINDRTDSGAYCRFVRAADGRAMLEADAGVRWAYKRWQNDGTEEIVGDMSVWDAFDEDYRA